MLRLLQATTRVCHGGAPESMAGNHEGRLISAASDTSTVLLRIATGEPQAVSECIDRYGGLVWSLARRFCHNPADAEDAVQEIFTEIWSSAERFDPSVASEATFIAMIARRRLIDQQRRRGRRPRTEPLDGAAEASTPDDAGDSLETQEEAQRVLEVFKSLSVNQQQALRMAIYENCTHAEIADKLDMPLGTVKTNIRRGLIRVREILGVSGGDEQGGDP